MTTDPALAFLAGGGATGALIRTHDWGSTPLGNPGTWPPSLKTLVGVMLGSNQPMFIAWGPGRTMLYNDGYAELCRDRHPAALGASFGEVWWDILADVGPILDGAFAGDATHMDDIEFALMRDGRPQEAHFEFSYTPVRDDAGIVAGMFCACRETTDEVATRRAAAAAANRHRESEARYRTIFEETTDFIVATDLDQRVTVCNPAAAAALGYTPDEVVGRLISDFVGVAEFERTTARLQAKLAGGGPTQYELKLYDRRGRSQLWEINSSLSRDADGRPVGLHILARDVSEARATQAALTLSEERLRLAIEGAGVGLWDWDLAAMRGWWSPRTAEIMGVKAGDTVTLAERMERIHPGDRCTLRAQLEAALAAGGEFVHEYRIVRPDGEIRHISSRGIVIRDGAGKAVRTTGTVIDVTEDRSAEAALAESEGRLRRAQDATGVGSYEWDVATGSGQQSDSMLRIIGLEGGRAYSLKEVVATVVPEDRGAVMATVEAIGKGAERAETDYRIRRTDDEVRWIRDIGQLERDADGKPARWVGVVQDVTERKTAELALSDNEARLRLAQDSGGIGLWDWDLTTGETWWSDKLYDIVGLDRAAPRGIDTFIEMIHPEDRAVAADAAQAAIEGNGRLDIEFRVRQVDGRTLWLASRGEVLRDAAGEARRVVGVNFDVTARKAAEAALTGLNEALQDRVAEAVAERELVLAQLHEAQKLETLGQLTGGVAHDFNNLLTPIVGSLDLLRRRLPDDPRSARLIDGALQAADRAQTLVARLLAFGRRQLLQPRPVDVAELLRGLNDLIQRSIGQHIGVVVEPAADLPPARIDPNQLELAILNLAVNSRDAMPGGGTLTIAAHPATVGPINEQRLRPGCYVRLSVIDTGTGMDEDTLKRAVEPFFTTKGVGKGTGLGLSMIHGLAGQMGGALKLSSTVGIGTRVDLWLPVAEAPLAAKPEAIVTAARPLAAAAVLLVDDEELVRMGAAEMLAELGYAVVEAASGAEALARIESGDPVDALVTDFLMPGMNGGELIEAARQIRPKLPALIVSGYANVEGVPEGVPILAKPFRHNDLAAEVAAVIDAGKIMPLRRAAEPVR